MESGNLKVDVADTTTTSIPIPSLASGGTDFGGGSAHATPPNPPQSGAGALSGGLLCEKCRRTVPLTVTKLPSTTIPPTSYAVAECQTDLFVSFSPQTCIQLLPTLSEKQKSFEAIYFKTFNAEFNLRGRHPSDHANTTALQNILTENVMSDSEKVITAHNTLTRDFTYLLDEAKRHLHDIRTLKLLRS